MLPILDSNPAQIIIKIYWTVKRSMSFSSCTEFNRKKSWSWSSIRGVIILWIFKQAFDWEVQERRAIDSKIRIRKIIWCARLTLFSPSRQSCRIGKPFKCEENIIGTGLWMPLFNCLAYLGILKFRRREILESQRVFDSSWNWISFVTVKARELRPIELLRLPTRF